MRTVLALGIAAALLVGCGSDSDDGETSSAGDQASAGDVAQAYANAVAAEDPVAACEQLSSDFRPDPEACPETVGDELVKGGSKVDFLGEVESVEVDGDAARVEFEGGGFLDLQKQDGRWYVELTR